MNSARALREVMERFDERIDAAIQAVPHPSTIVTDAKLKALRFAQDALQDVIAGVLRDEIRGVEEETAVCSVCGANLAAWRETFNEEHHYYAGAENDLTYHTAVGPDPRD